MKTINLNNLKPKEYEKNVLDIIDNRHIIHTKGLKVAYWRGDGVRTLIKEIDGINIYKYEILLKLFDLVTGDIEVIKIILETYDPDAGVGFSPELHAFQNLGITLRSLSYAKNKLEKVKPLVDMMNLPYKNMEELYYLVYMTKIYSSLRAKLKDGTNIRDYRNQVEDNWKHVSEALSDKNHIFNFVAGLEIKTFREAGNDNEKTFDGFNVYVSLVGSGQGITFEELVEKFKQNKRAIDNIVVGKLASSPKFTRYGVPVNILKLDRVQVLRNFTAIYTFSIKEVKSEESED